jgi:hypothetical protein
MGTRDVVVSFAIIVVGTDEVDLFDFVDLTEDIDAVRLRNDDFAVGVGLKFIKLSLDLISKSY